jgi:DNA polymerase/3'-5' exonuclease PolX
MEKRYPWGDAMEVAEEIRSAIEPACARIEIAGSLRRHKADVGDIEILYIPKMREQDDPGKLFEKRTVNLADDMIRALISGRILECRLNSKGSRVYGEKNKLMRHVASGIPVDLFATTPEAWWNYLVCRTGPAALNKRICNAAIAKGWHWMPYGVGFQRIDEPDHVVRSERDVFDFVALPYLEPEER